MATTTTGRDILSRPVYMGGKVRDLFAKYLIPFRALTIFEIMLGNGHATIAMSQWQVAWPEGTETEVSGEFVYIYLPNGITLWTHLHEGDGPLWIDLLPEER